jgi:nucleoside-triphosphatase THEP1
LFKNHNNTNDDLSNLKIEKLLEQKRINSILYDDPFLKVGFISKLVQDTEIDILYLDLDLLYSGYTVSGTLPSKDNVALFQPTVENLGRILTEIISRASISQTLIIIDSLNGLFNILNRKKDVGKIVTSIIMLLASISQIANSYVVVASMARYKKEEGWILSPTGKRLIETKNSKQILLEHDNEGIILNLLTDSRKFLLRADSIPF